MKDALGWWANDVGAVVFGREVDCRVSVREPTAKEQERFTSMGLRLGEIVEIKPVDDDGGVVG
jgi:hypothetical protein